MALRPGPFGLALFPLDNFRTVGVKKTPFFLWRQGLPQAESLAAWYSVLFLDQHKVLPCGRGIPALPPSLRACLFCIPLALAPFLCKPENRSCPGQSSWHKNPLFTLFLSQGRPAPQALSLSGRGPRIRLLQGKALFSGRAGFPQSCIPCRIQQPFFSA